MSFALLDPLPQPWRPDPGSAYEEHPKMHIAIVTYNWPPRNASGTQRPYSWAKYWSRLGVQVTVLTSRKQTFDEPLDLDFPTLPGVDVIEVDFGSSRLGVSPRVSTGVVSVLKRLKRLVRVKLGLVLDPRDAWARAARGKSLEIADRVDAVVSTFGPRSSHIIASHMKRHQPKLLWVADYRDLWSNNYLGGYSHKALHKERSLELGTVGSGADVVVTISDELAEQQKSYLGKDVWVIPNGFDQENLPVPMAAAPKPMVRIVYTGMIYPGFRDPTPLLVALKELVDEGRAGVDSLRVEFYGPAESWLGDLVASFNLGPLVQICGRVSRDESLARQASADVLLLLESGAPEAAGVLTGKLFEYLAANRPILSLGSRTGFAISRVIEECGAGACVEDDVARVKKILLDVLSGGPLSWFTPNPSAIARYSRESQATLLLDLIKGTLAQNRVAEDLRG